KGMSPSPFSVTPYGGSVARRRGLRFGRRRAAGSGRLGDRGQHRIRGRSRGRFGGSRRHRKVGAGRIGGSLRFRRQRQIALQSVERIENRAWLLAFRG